MKRSIKVSAAVVLTAGIIVGAHPGFVPVPAPTLAELKQLVERISQRVG